MLRDGDLSPVAKFAGSTHKLIMILWAPSGQSQPYLSYPTSSTHLATDRDRENGGSHLSRREQLNIMTVWLCGDVNEAPTWWIRKEHW